MVVFSKTSLQFPLISAANPRAIYFTDDVAVAWMRGGFIENRITRSATGRAVLHAAAAGGGEPRLLRANRSVLERA
jgi:hypothetical protein